MAIYTGNGTCMADCFPDSSRIGFPEGDPAALPDTVSGL